MSLSSEGAVPARPANPVASILETEDKETLGRLGTRLATVQSSLDAILSALAILQERQEATERSLRDLKAQVTTTNRAVVTTMGKSNAHLERILAIESEQAEGQSAMKELKGVMELMIILMSDPQKAKEIMGKKEEETPLPTEATGMFL